MFEPSVQHPLGVNPVRLTVNLVAGSSAFQRGQVGVLDLSGVVSGNNDIGKEDSGLSMIVAADATDQKFGIAAVAVESIAQSVAGRWVMTGEVDAIVEGPAQRGDFLTLGTTSRSLVPSVDQAKVFAVCLEDQAGTGLTRVLFEGVHGFGQD